MPLALFNGPLTNVFQPSLPSMVKSDRVVLDFTLVIANTVTPPGTRASIEWYPEFTWMDPNGGVATTWFCELAEEDQGTGDVRMAVAVRRFAANLAETELPPGTHNLDAQFKRVHAFFRIQIRVAPNGADTCRATVWDPFGTQLVSAP